MAETTAFQERVYAKLTQVQKGNVTTYGDLARATKSGPRAIGQAMRCNPYAPRVPCHRVVKSDGGIGGFDGETSGERIKEKISLLKEEGIKITAQGKILNFQQVRHQWQDR